MTQARQPVRLGAVVLGALLLLWPQAASAEIYVSGYLGASVTQDSDVKDRDHMTPGFPRFSLRYRNVGFHTSFTGGGKVGYWIRPLPWLGVEADVYHFSPDIGTQTVTIAENFFGGPAPGSQVTLGAGGFDRASIGVTSLGFHLLGRLRLLQGGGYPNGQFQPYLGVGPAIFITTVRLTPFTNQSERETNVGVQVLGGLKYFLHRNVAAFVEYKLSHFGFDISGFGGGTTKLTGALTTHHASGGVALHFDLF